MIRIDEDIENADWIKALHWDLPTTVKGLVESFGVDGLPGLLRVPAAKAMPPELRQQVEAVIASRTKRKLVKSIDAIMMELKRQGPA